MLKALIVKIKSFFGGNQVSLFDFNVVGLDDYSHSDRKFLIQVDKVKKNVNDFNVSMKEEAESASRSAVIGEQRRRKNLLAKQIIEKVIELQGLGKADKICKSDYKKLRQDLLLTLFSLFATSADAEVFEYAVRSLEENSIVPSNSRLEIAKLSPLGRWL